MREILIRPDRYRLRRSADREIGEGMT